MIFLLQKKICIISIVVAVIVIILIIIIVPVVVSNINKKDDRNSSNNPWPVAKSPNAVTCLQKVKPTNWIVAKSVTKHVIYNNFLIYISCELLYNSSKCYCALDILQEDNLMRLVIILCVFVAWRVHFNFLTLCYFYKVAQTFCNIFIYKVMCSKSGNMNLIDCILPFIAQW